VAKCGGGGGRARRRTAQRGSDRIRGGGAMGGLEEKEAERWPEAAVDHGRALTCASDESRIN
jgi:hypothetical protein